MDRECFSLSWQDRGCQVLPAGVLPETEQKGCKELRQAGVMENKEKFGLEGGTEETIGSKGIA